MVEALSYNRQIDGAAPAQNAAPSNAKYWTKEITDKTGDVKNLLIKPLYHATGWMDVAGISKNYSWTGPLSEHSKITKNFMSATEILPKSVDVARGVWDMFSSRSTVDFAGAAHRTVIDGSGLTSSICDGLETGLKTGIIPHAADTLSSTLRTVGLVNAGSLFIASTDGVVKEMSAIGNARVNDPTLSADQLNAERHKVGYSLLKFGKWGFYGGLSTTSLAVFAGLLTAAPWVFLAWSTGALSCTIGQFFYKRAFNVQDN